LKIRRFLVAAALVFAPMTAQAAEPVTYLDLGDGYQFKLIEAGDTPAKVAHPKVIFINVALKDAKIAGDHTKLIEAADRLFETVLMGAAEKGYYKRATVNIQKAGQAGGYEDFVYARGDNDVWLRQAGDQPWKTAQDPKWTPPSAETIEVKPFGTFAVETAVEIAPPEGFTRAAEIDFVTKTPLVDLQHKYQEIKALWARIDRAQLKADGFDMVLLGNFTEAQRGRFHARKGFFVRIPREESGDWPELPDRAPDDRDALISKNDAPAGNTALASLASDVFAGRGQAEAQAQAVRLWRLSTTASMALAAEASAGAKTAATSAAAKSTIAAGSPDHATPSLAAIAFGHGLPVVRLDPQIFVVKFETK
jgi:hypothetical protein